MSKPPAAPAANAAAPPKGKKSLLILIVASALVAVGAGVAVPMFLLPKMHADAGTKGHESKYKPTGKRAYVPFGDVVVNLNEEKLHRFLRIKLLLVVDEGYEKQLIEQVAKIKPELKNWLIAYLSDKSLNDVTGAAGVNRLRREIWGKFNGEMFPDGSEHIQDVIFEEFNIQ
jgi:flagellar FliL protein